MVAERTGFPLPTTQRFLIWTIVLLLSSFAWIVLLQQFLGMLSSAGSQIGTMGLTPGPFLLFWLLMMVAMMLPALAPNIVARYQLLRQQNGTAGTLLLLLLFLMVYLLLWTLFGLPVFVLAHLGEQLVRSTPALSIDLGTGLLLLIGIYQMTPLERRYLTRCNLSPCCNTHRSASYGPLNQLREGLTNGLHCLGCCGPLMLIMVTVGLMNLPWMFLLTIVILLEKIWQHGVRLSFFVGFALLIFTVLAFVEPALLSGLYRPL